MITNGLFIIESTIGKDTSMNGSNILLVIGILGVAWYAVSSMLICNALQKRGFKLNFILLRLFIIKYASQYKEITTAETGKTGPLFYHWIISINVVLLMAILIVLFKFG
jgi:hypothetical protein